MTISLLLVAAQELHPEIRSRFSDDSLSYQLWHPGLPLPDAVTLTVIVEDDLLQSIEDDWSMSMVFVSQRVERLSWANLQTMSLASWKSWLHEHGQSRDFNSSFHEATDEKTVHEQHASFDSDVTTPPRFSTMDLSFAEDEVYGETTAAPLPTLSPVAPSLFAFEEEESGNSAESILEEASAMASLVGQSLSDSGKGTQDFSPSTNACVWVALGKSGIHSFLELLEILESHSSLTLIVHIDHEWSALQQASLLQRIKRKTSKHVEWAHEGHILENVGVYLIPYGHTVMDTLVVQEDWWSGLEQTLAHQPGLVMVLPGLPSALSFTLMNLVALGSPLFAVENEWRLEAPTHDLLATVGATRGTPEQLAGDVDNCVEQIASS